MNHVIQRVAGLILVLVITVGTAVGVGVVDVNQRSDETTLAIQNATDANETISEENITGNVTIVNVGENVSVDAFENVTIEEPTVFIGPSVSEGPNVTTGPEGMQINVTQEYVLGGRVSGWQGAAPDSIDGTVNPTLNLSAGQLYAITWVNLDGVPHNVAITNADGETVAATKIIAGQGTSQTLVFRVPDDPGTYYCEVHPNSMRGNITLVMNATA